MNNTTTGVLLVNLGTPASPAPSDVRRYLIEFLTDGRVIDLPWLWRQLLVRGTIVPRRYKESAHNYQKIWTAEGSPLLLHSQKTQQALQHKLGDSFRVELAMRYQQPSMESAIDKLLNANISQLIILPLFPQYASATTGSVQQKSMEILKLKQLLPTITFVSHFCEHPLFIKALCEIAKPFPFHEYDRLIFSFHGLPQRQLTKTRPEHCTPQTQQCCAKKENCQALCYSAQCHATANAMISSLNLPSDRCQLSFQSRLGKEPWLEPYTSDVIAECARQGDKKLLLFCPAFTSDCLETIYEISMEYGAEFAKLGGERLDLVPSLNDHPAWIEALSAIVLEHQLPGLKAIGSLGKSTVNSAYCP